MTTLLPLLEVIKNLIDLIEQQNVFVVFFLAGIKKCQQNLYTMYIEMEMAYTRNVL